MNIFFNIVTMIINQWLIPEGGAINGQPIYTFGQTSSDNNQLLNQATNAETSKNNQIKQNVYAYRIKDDYTISVIPDGAQDNPNMG